MPTQGAQAAKPDNWELESKRRELLKAFYHSRSQLGGEVETDDGDSDWEDETDSDESDPYGEKADAAWDKLDAAIQRNPARYVKRLRQLWEQRVRHEKNKELEDLTSHISGFSQSLEDYLHPDDIDEPSEEGRRMATFRDLYRAGLTAVCELFVQEDDFFQEREDWISEVLRIIGQIVQWGTIETEDLGNWPAIYGILRLTRITCANVWANRERLLDDEKSIVYGNQNGLRISVAQILFELDLLQDNNDPAIRKDIRSTKIDVRRLEFFVWISGSPPNDLNRAFFGRETFIPVAMSDTLFGKVLETFAEDPADPKNRTREARMHAFLRDDVLSVYGAEKFMHRLNASLRESRLDMPLEGLLSMIWEVAIYPVVTPHLQTYGTYIAIREVCDRQALHGDTEVDQCLVLAQALWIYRRTFTHQPAAEIAYIVRNCNVIELIARYVRLYATLGHQAATGGTDPTKPLHIVQMYASFAEITNLRSGKNTLRKTMRNTLRQDWYPTLHVLRTQRDDKLWRGKHRKQLTDLLIAWTALGTSIGLDEETERRDYEREVKRMSMVCAWKECKYHTEKPPTSLHSCKGCGEVKYCSRDCQRKDWIDGEHKARCRRIKDASSGRTGVLQLH
ncbi:unnamed protein product [Peniophora sp. CBMAI 1063]|nr:unnamed protein product [Peniophora sp. CBMAI 1063]